MGGRYSIAIELDDLEERFGATFAGGYVPRYDAAPSQKLPVILNADPGKIVFSVWGLKPVWMAEVSRRDGLINVRLETLRDKPTFRKDLEERRCFIPADGFYEWETLAGGQKVPLRIVRRDSKPFAFAGIWENAADGETGLPRFAIVTTAADAFMQPIHSRMPVILNPAGEQAWLSRITGRTDLLDLLESAPPGPLKAYEVSPKVNRASSDDPELIKSV